MYLRPLGLSLALLLAACHAADVSSPAPARAPESKLAPPPGAPVQPTYTLVQIRTGPKSGQLTKEENDRAFAGHFENMGRMAHERQLVTAGPYGARRHDPALRGIFLLATAERAEAERWASTDPTTQAGVFVLEYHTLATRAPIAASHERAMAWVAAEKAAGRNPAPGEHARTYVWLTAEHGDLAQREFAPLQSADGGVYLIAELDTARALVLLDADSLPMAEERFAPQLAEIGAYTLDEWFGTDELAAMAAGDR